MSRTIKLKPGFKINKELKDCSSIQEKKPHHTAYCFRCGFLYPRKRFTSPSCPKCKIKYKKVCKVGEFWVRPEKNQIIVSSKSGSELEKKRKG